MLEHTPYSKKITKLFNIAYPILQAPMAGGISTPLLAAAVSNNGALGALAGGYLSAEALDKQILELKALIKLPFQVNLFACPNFKKVESDVVYQASQRLQSIWKSLDISFPEYSADAWCLPDLSEQIDIIIEHKVPVVSFTFGVPDREIITALKNANIKIIGTATHLLEAILWEELGVDAVVIQGLEAGGHRATFIGDPLFVAQTTAILIGQAVDEIQIPIIAAGGIMNAKSIKAALCLGADAVMLGTAFITALESGAHYLYKQRLISCNELEIGLTQQWTGKWARGIYNTFLQKVENEDGDPAPFPIQHFLTESIRRAALVRDDEEYMALWAGTGAYACEEKPAADLIKKWTSELYL